MPDYYLKYPKDEGRDYGDIGEVIVDGKIVEVVMSFICRRELIQGDGFYDKELRRRITMDKTAILEGYQLYGKIGE